MPDSIALVCFIALALAGAYLADVRFWRETK